MNRKSKKQNMKFSSYHKTRVTKRDPCFVCFKKREMFTNNLP